MRATIQNLLVSTPQLTALIPTERWFQAGSVIDVPPKPFSVLKWLSPVPGAAAGTFAHQLQVAVYDERRSYARIETILGGPYQLGPSVYTVLSGISDLTGVDGRISQADYLGDSGDDVDVDFKANVRYSSWQIAGRKTS